MTRFDPPTPNAKVKSVRVSADRLTVGLMDGRIIAVPLAWFPRLAKAKVKDLANWRIVAGGLGVHWPELDEDIGVLGLLRTHDDGVGENGRRARMTMGLKRR